MAFPRIITALLFALALARIDPSSCQVLKAKVTCLDCPHSPNLSGIKVSVRCEKVRKPDVITTEHDGSFEAELPSGSVKCLAKLEGGTMQIYAQRNKMVSQIVKAKEPNSYTMSTPLAFFTKYKSRNNLDSSKTVDLPLPREWGLAPSSYYVPFVPIIGVP